MPRSWSMSSSLLPASLRPSYDLRRRRRRRSASLIFRHRPTDRSGERANWAGGRLITSPPSTCIVEYIQSAQLFGQRLVLLVAIKYNHRHHKKEEKEEEEERGIVCNDMPLQPPQARWESASNRIEWEKHLRAVEQLNPPRMVLCTSRQPISTGSTQQGKERENREGMKSE